MGRHLKEGLSYFPMDVDFFEDEKVQFVSARFGVKGDGILSRILCKIYRQGYGLQFDDDTALLFARSVGDINLHGLVKDVVNECLKRDFFDDVIFKKFGMLTSKGIQKRYVKICADARRKDWSIPEKFDLLNGKTVFTHEEIEKTPEESTQRKEKESKGKESKAGRRLSSLPVSREMAEAQRELKKGYEEFLGQLGDKDRNHVWEELKAWILANKPEFAEPYAMAWNVFADTYKLEQVKLITDERKRKFSTRISEPAFDFFLILKHIKESRFMKGDNANGWKVDFNFIIHSESNYVKILEGKYK